MGRAFWTEQEIQFLKDNCHVPLAEISKALNRPIRGIADKYCTLGIKRTQRRRFTDDEKYFINENFDALTNEELAQKLNLTRGQVKSYLYKQGLLRKNENRSHYFSKPIDQEYAYLLGWFFSDGCISRKYNAFSISLLETDACYIEQFLKRLYPWSIDRVFREKYPTFKPQVRYGCHRKDVVEYICTEWDFHEKSNGFPQKFFNIIDKTSDSCKRCFLRGFFDGDGYVELRHPYCSITKRIDYDWTYFLRLIPSDVKTTFRYKNTEKSKGASIQILKDAPLFFQYIYNTEFDAALPRKKNIVLAHFEKPYYRDKYGPLINE